MKADDIGNAGQYLCGLLLTQVRAGRARPYFRPRFLGEGFPTVDYLVELIDSAAWFCFIQVKATNRGYRGGRGGRRLRVDVDAADAGRMAASPIPCYVAGIDLDLGAGYLLSMNEPRRGGIGGLPTRHPMDLDNLERLWNEVRAFWMARDMALAGSHFV